MGGWGDLGSMPQKGIVHYGLSINRQNPFAGAFSAAIFNTFRRTRHQILFWSIPIIIGYETMEWAIERYVDRRPEFPCSVVDFVLEAPDAGDPIEKDGGIGLARTFADSACTIGTTT